MGEALPAADELPGPDGHDLLVPGAARARVEPGHSQIGTGQGEKTDEIARGDGLGPGGADGSDSDRGDLAGRGTRGPAMR
jgi:hypothetical protein